jgi:hypothetical protein
VGPRRRRLHLLPRLGGAGQGCRRGGVRAPAWQHLLLLLRFTSDLALISNGPARLDIARLEYPRRAGVVIREDPAAGVEADGDRLAAVRFVTGETLSRDALFVVTARRQPSDLAARLGCSAFPEGPRAGVLDADATGRTSAPNVWAAGSSVNPSLTVIGAAGHASTVAIAINNALIDEDVVREIAAWDASPDVADGDTDAAVAATRRNVHATPVRLRGEP